MNAGLRPLRGTALAMAMGTIAVVAVADQTVDLSRVDATHTKVSIVARPSFPGGKALKIPLSGDYPTVTFRAGKAYPSADWAAHYYSLEFDFYLDAPGRPMPPADDAVPLFMEFFNGRDGDPKRPRRTFVFNPFPNELGHMSVTTLGLRMGTEGLLASGHGFGRVVAWDTNVDTKDIAAFDILTDHATRPCTLYIGNVRLTPRHDGPLVDKFGQFALHEWPGKVHSEAELTAAGRRDLELLKQSPRRPGFDAYGGWLGGTTSDGKPLRFEATGFFRVQQADGRWWLVTPAGNPFWSLGVDGVIMEGASPQWDPLRASLYAWIPPKTGRFAAAWQRSWSTGPVYSKANLIRRYGASFEKDWHEVTAWRLLHWGFNTLGAWSDLDVARQAGLRIPYVVILQWLYNKPEMAANLPDIWDPVWVQRTKQSVDEAAKWNDDPWCIGYMFGNEVAWCGGWQKKPTVGRQVLAKGPGSHAKQVLVEMLRKRHGDDIRKLNTAWGTSFASFDAILSKPVKLSPEAEARAEPDFSAFLAATADRYYGTVARELKRVAPNHLFLGSRFAQRPIEAVRAAGRYCDVVSFNIYVREIDRAEYDRLYAATHKPFIVGEFQFGARDRGDLSGGGVPVGSQTARALAYRHYVRSLAAVPYFVGCHWFDWEDQPPLGRTSDGWEAGNTGVVDVCDNPYPELTAAMRETNRAIYELAAQAGRR